MSSRIAVGSQPHIGSLNSTISVAFLKTECTKRPVIMPLIICSFSNEVLSVCLLHCESTHK
jgi:hypothetical protein